MLLKLDRCLHICFTIATCMAIFLKPHTVISQTNPPAVSVSPYVIEIQQPDGTTIHIIGKVDNGIAYTETKDGYTLLKNKKNVYEYAKKVSDGSLKLSGLKAKDPEKRSEKEKISIASIPKHLRSESSVPDTLFKQ